jgi:hypothetical protein
MKTLYSISFSRFAMVSAAAVLLVSALPAQTDRQDRPDQAAARIEQLQQRLNMTPEQVERARPVLEHEAQQMREVLRDFDRNSASMRDKRKVARQLKSIRENADKHLKGILTPAQMDTLKRIREERREQMRANGREGV